MIIPSSEPWEWSWQRAVKIGIASLIGFSIPLPLETYTTFADAVLFGFGVLFGSILTARDVHFVGVPWRCRG